MSWEIESILFGWNFSFLVQVCSFTGDGISQNNIDNIVIGCAHPYKLSFIVQLMKF